MPPTSFPGGSNLPQQERGIHTTFAHTGHANFDFNWCSIFIEYSFSFEKAWNDQNHSLSDFHHLIKESSQQNFPFPQLGENLPQPLTLYEKTCNPIDGFFTNFSTFQYISSHPLKLVLFGSSQLTTTCPKITIKPLEQGVKYVQS